MSRIWRVLRSSKFNWNFQIYVGVEMVPGLRRIAVPTTDKTGEEHAMRVPPPRIDICEQLRN